jgi:predicted HTH domain antitoxin
VKDAQVKKEQMVGSRLPMDLVADLDFIEKTEQSDRSTTVRKLLKKAVGDWKMEYFARQYGDGRLTLARAASDAGVSLWEMLDYVRQRKVSAQYDLSDLEHDFAVVEARQSRKPAQLRVAESRREWKPSK